MRVYRKALIPLRACGFLMLAGMCTFPPQLDAQTPRGLLDLVAAARARGEGPGAVTVTLMDQGYAAPRAAYAVAATWQDCDATREAVRTAVHGAREQVAAIVAVMAGLRACGCSTANAWARPRLDGRLRPAAFVTLPIEMPEPCGCVTAAVEAATAAAPERADVIVKAAIEAAQGLGLPADTVGQRSDDLDRLFASSLADEPQGIYRRRPDACEPDASELDTSTLERDWIRGEAERFRDVGRHELRCTDAAPDGLLLTELGTGGARETYVEFYNASDRAVDLSAAAWRLSVFYAGLPDRGHSISLRGTIGPGRSYVVAAAGADEQVRRRANLIVPEIGFRIGDALALHPGWGEENCQCAEAIVAGSMRAPALAADLAPQDPGAGELVRNKLLRIFGRVPLTAPGEVLDTLGRVSWDPIFAAGVTPLAPRLRRREDTCRSDYNELDAAPGTAWEALAAARGAGGVGVHSARCEAPGTDLLLSDFYAAPGDVGAVELFNPTPADLDLADGGYLLEVYRQGDPSPSATIPLTGYVEGQGSFLVATSRALPSLDAQADLTVSSLDAENVSALVLKKRLVPAVMSCSAQVAGVLEAPLPPGDLFFVEPPNSFDPGAPPVDRPPTVGTPASPN